MRFPLRNRLTRDTEYYDLDPIVKYADYLDEQGRILWVGNLAFDAEAMMRPFLCDTRQCIADAQGRIGGRKRKTCSCCVSYTPRLSTDERKRIDRILPALRSKYPDLAERIDAGGTYYYWDDNYDRLVEKADRGFCVFLSPTPMESGIHGCLIHAHCLEEGLSPELYKPAACVMFPLFLLDIDSDEGTMLISAHSREVMEIGEDEDNYYKVGCLRKGATGTLPLYISMKNTLVHMFNDKAWQLLDKAMRKWCEENERPLPPSQPQASPPPETT